MSAQLSDMIGLAAQLGALGLDPMKFINTRDDVERSFMAELARRISEEKSRMDHNLAVDIANQVGKLFKN
jgi:hypothetical protein